MIDQYLEKLGLKYEDLNSDERSTLSMWMDSLTKNELTMEKVRTYVKAMRDSVEQELTSVAHNSKQDIFLKARLRNYMLFDAFLATPERAKQALEQALSGLIKK